MINKQINTRVNITIPKDLYEQIQSLAFGEMRSASSLMVYLMSEELKKEEWQDKIKNLK